MKKIALVVVLILIASSGFATSASLFPDWTFKQGMQFLTGFGCTVGLTVYGTLFISEVFSSGPVDPIEVGGLAILNGFFLLTAYMEYMDLFTDTGRLRHLYQSHHQGDPAYSTEIKIQGFTIGRIY